MSLSARRAWIEIVSDVYANFSGFVALRKESVDRNDAVQIVIVVMHASLSARRAWIEICGGVCGKLLVLVALRKESVDRNQVSVPCATPTKRRSPQGERG